MKSGGPLRRTSELSRAEPIRRSGKGLDRSSTLLRAALVRAPAKRRLKPAKRAKGEFSGRARLLMWLRFAGVCVVCGRELPRKGWTAQHRRARGMGGTHDPVSCSVAAGLAVHELPCHRRIEDNPAWALSMGYRVPQGADPLGWPVTDWLGRVFRLTKDGGASPVPTSEES